MIKSTDVGSVYFGGNFDEYYKARTKLLRSDDRNALEYFGPIITKMFIDKAKRLDTPMYTQIAGKTSNDSTILDMNEMFLQLFNGIEKVRGGYEIVGLLDLKELNCYIPEVYVLEKNSKFIAEKVNRRPVEYSICLTDPHCLSWKFVNRDLVSFKRLGYILAQILEKTAFSNKYMRLARVSVDDPTLGEFDDPLIDLDRPEREELRKSWEIICEGVKSKDATTSMHLHNTTEKLFWEVDSLDVIQSHVNESLYTSPTTKKLLEDNKDKKIFASICKTNPDRLIDRNTITRFQKKGETVTESILGEQKREAWEKIKSGSIDPVVFLESEKTMKKRLIKIGGDFDWERIAYAGPECGFNGLYSYGCNLVYWERPGNVIRDVNEEMKLSL